MKKTIFVPLSFIVLLSSQAIAQEVSMTPKQTKGNEITIPVTEDSWIELTHRGVPCCNQCDGNCANPNEPACPTHSCI